MAVPGDPYDEPLRGAYARHAALLPAGTEWFDAHTHVGADDPDGYHATAAEILAGLDRAGHSRALVFPLHEPSGYPPANDRVLAAAESSGGRLQALCRLDPHDSPQSEAQRCLEGGAIGFKLHPRAERFTMGEPAVEQLVALAAERRLPVLIHAGRGIPALGRDTVTLARRHPGARLILAHAGISDLAWIWRDAQECPNLFFDTSWWNVADLLALFACVPPGQILYGSDMPYGSAVFCGFAALRCGAGVGLGPDALGEVVGGQLERLLAGDEAADLGPAPGPPAEPRPPAAERAVSHLCAAASRRLGGVDPSESLALARLSCDVPDDDPSRPLLDEVAGLVDAARDAWQAEPEQAAAVLIPAMAAALIAGTPALRL